MAVASALTIVFRAPLEGPANPAVTPNPAKAPWYFLWLQELVTTTTVTIGGFTINGALVGGIIIPGLLVVAALAWPYFDKSAVRSVGVWFAKERRRQNLVFLLIVLAILILTVIGTFLRGPYWNFYWPWESWPEMPRKF
jgi:quinol-cytochrome oxidoreductase complex cytochrome b subunit